MVLCCLFSVPFVFRLFVIIVVSHFGLEGWNWVLIASVPDLCIFLTYMILFVTLLYV